MQLQISASDVSGAPTTPLGLAAAFTPPGKRMLLRQGSFSQSAQHMQQGKLADRLLAGSLAGMEEMASQKPAQQQPCSGDWPKVICPRSYKAHTPAPVTPVEPSAASNKASGSKRHRLVSDLGPVAVQADDRVAEASDQHHEQHAASAQLKVLPFQQAGGKSEGTAGDSKEQLSSPELPGLNGSSQACQAGANPFGTQQTETCPVLQMPAIRPRVRKTLFQNTSAGGQEDGAGAALHQPKETTAAPSPHVDNQRQKEQDSGKEQNNVEALSTTLGARSMANPAEKPAMQPAFKSVFSFL